MAFRNLNPSNIIHKAVMRVADMIQVIGGFKESNRVKTFASIVANNTAKDFFIAPWKGVVESIVVNSPSGATTSSSSNHLTITLTDVTSGATIFTFDTFTNSTELTQNLGLYIQTASLALSNGAPSIEFNGGDVLACTILVTGTPGITSANSLEIVFNITPQDKNFAY